MTVVSALRLEARPGAGGELERRFAELAVLERARSVAGFRRGALLRSRSDAEVFLVLAEWESASAYEAWLASEDRAAVGAQLRPVLADEPSAGELYGLVHGVEPDRGRE